MCTLNTTEIFLTWRKDIGQRRYLIGKVYIDLDNYIFKYINKEELQQAQKNGFKSYPAFQDIEKVYDKDVIKIFSRRLPSSLRKDYDAFLDYWSAKEYKDNTFAILALTDAKLPTDFFEFIAPHYERPATFYTEVAGLHHTDKNILKTLTKNNYQSDCLRLEREPTNPYDEKAVRVLFCDQPLGYIKIIHCNSIFSALEDKREVKASIKNITRNGLIQEILLRIEIN